MSRFHKAFLIDKTQCDDSERLRRCAMFIGSFRDIAIIMVCISFLVMWVLMIVKVI
jgi:hypothetical protein